MRWYALATNDLPEEPVLGIDLSSYEAFMKSLKALPRERVSAMQEQMNELSRKSLAPGPGWVELYHGTPGDSADQIMEAGFSLGEGRRSLGFMGAEYRVANQGVFLTDDKGLASYFGSNRAEHPSDYRVLTCYVNASTVMDFASAPREIVRLGLDLVNKYEGTRKTRLAMRDWWWLLDQPEFVETIKQHGYSGIRFKEATPILRAAGAKTGNSYLIFDPATIRIKGKDGISTVKDYYEWLASGGKASNP